MMNETLRTNSLPQQTQAAIDAANARASEAEARAERAEAPIRFLRNFFRLLMRGVVVIVIHYTSMAMIYDFFWDRHTIEDQVAFTPSDLEPRPTSSIPTPTRPIAVRLPMDSVGYGEVMTFDCRTGEELDLLNNRLDPQYTGVAIRDNISFRIACGCPPVSAGTTPTRRVGFDNVRIEIRHAPEPVAPPKQTSAPVTCGAIDRFRSISPALAAQVERLGERMSAVEQDLDRHPLPIP